MRLPIPPFALTSGFISYNDDGTVCQIFLMQFFESGVAHNVIALVSYVRTNPKPKRELRREAPQLSFGFYVLTCLTK